MSNILIRDVPERVHRELMRRADRSGRSLQQYLVSELTRLAERPTLDEALRRVEQRRGGRVGLEQAVADLAEERSRR